MRVSVYTSVVTSCAIRPSERACAVHGQCSAWSDGRCSVLPERPHAARDQTLLLTRNLQAVVLENAQRNEYRACVFLSPHV